MNETPSNWSTDRLAGWTAELSFGDLPSEVVAKVEDCMLDAIGCAIAGLETPAALAVTGMAASCYPTGHSTVWFKDAQLNSIGAAYANASATSALDIDDGHRLAMGHPGAAVIPTALAIAETIKADGRDVIAAIVAGYEIAVRLGHAEIRKPYHTGNWSGFGAAVAAARLMRLDRKQIMHTLAITAYHSPRLTDLTQSKFMGSDVKESIPWSVVTGMSAAELAMRGFTGCRDALDLQGRFDPEVIGAGLGDGFKIMGTYFKKYSVCRWAHTSISGLAEIMREQGLAAADLKSVSVDTFGQAAALNNSADPDNIISAQYSLPYTMALAAVYGEDAVSPLTDAMIGMPDAVQLAQRIAINHAPEMDAHLPSRTPARITVETADGRFEKTLITAWGDSGGETGRADYRAKFCMLAGRTLSSAHVDQIIDAVGRIRTGDMQALSRALFSGVSDAVRRAV